MKNEDVGNVSVKAVILFIIYLLFHRKAYKISRLVRLALLVARCDLSAKTRAEVSYVVSNTTAPGKCCAVFTKVACKAGETGQQLIKEVNNVRDACFCF